MTAIGAFQTALEAWWATAGATGDNFATNITNSAAARERGDSQWAVLIGTVLGMVPAVLGVVVGPALLNTKLGAYFCNPSRLKKAAAVLLFFLAAQKFHSSLRPREAKEPTGEAGPTPNQATG